jgi:hypothetical protein
VNDDDDVVVGLMKLLVITYELAFSNKGGVRRVTTTLINVTKQV